MSSWEISIIREGEDEQALKRKFAEEYLKNPLRPMEVAALIFDELPRQLYIADTWPRDTEVIRIVRELTSGRNADKMLPTQAELSLEILKIANADKPNGIRLAALKLYAEVNGMVSKPGITVNTNITQNRVMKVVKFGNIDEWEQKATAQQRRLTLDAVRQ